MKIRIVIVATLLASMLLAGAAACADPPRVVETSPAAGATGVDPATTVIRVVFDQPMHPGGRSIVGGGRHFPTITGPPIWRDERTIEIPIALAPARRYDLSFNNATFRNFRGANGEAATPYPLTFKTGGEPPAEERITVEQAAASIAQLREAIDQRYSYRDLRGVDWAARFDEFDARLRTARTIDDFAEAAAELLAVARDIHVGVIAHGERLPTFRAAIDPNVNVALLPQLVPQWTKLADDVFVGTFPDGIGYVLVTSWSRAASEAMTIVTRRFAAPEWALGLIIDVRPNGGGDELAARRLAGSFHDEPAVYSRNVYRDASQPTGFGPVLDRIVTPGLPAERYGFPVVVLSGPNVMSSNESFVLMMKEAPRCTVMGRRSYGSSGNPRPVALECGVTIVLPSWRDLLPDGTLLEGAGVPPDVEVFTRPGDFAERDPVLEAALQRLRAPH